MTTTLCVSIDGKIFVDTFAKIDDLNSNCVEFRRFSAGNMNLSPHFLTPST